MWVIQNETGWIISLFLFSISKQLFSRNQKRFWNPAFVLLINFIISFLIKYQTYNNCSDYCSFLNKVACKNKRFDFLKLIELSFDIFLEMRDCVFLFGFSLMFDLMSGTDYLTYIKI